MSIKPRKIPNKSKGIHKDSSQQLPNKRRIVLNQEKYELVVDRNVICYRELDPETQKIFITAIKQCILTGCISQIFSYPRNSRLKPLRINILDTDANHMIWKMIRVLSRQQCSNKLADLTEKLSQKQGEINQYEMMKSKLYKKHFFLQKKYNQMVEVSEKQQITTLLQEIDSQIKTIQCQQQKAETKKRMIRQKINLYKASVQISNKSNQLLSNCLDKPISEMVRDLICQSIIGIVQIPLQKNNESLPMCQQVYVIFQQCFTTAKIKFTDIIRIIGTSIYLNKCQSISKCISKPKKNWHSKIETLTICHICTEIFDASELTFCQNNIGKKQITPYCSFDIKLYRQNVIQSDYFSQPKTSATLPYFLYNTDQKGHLFCNRAFCKKCLKNIYNSQVQFVCPFCCGECNCNRCENGVKLVKLLAQDLEFDPQMEKNHYNILNIFHQKPSKYCRSGRLGLRTQRDRAQFYLLLPFIRKRLVAHSSINDNAKDSGQAKLKYLRWGRHLQERFLSQTAPNNLLDNQQDLNVDSGFHDPSYKYFEHQ